MRAGSHLWIVLVLVISCKDDKRERCVAMSDHVARLIADGDIFRQFMALEGTRSLIDKCVAQFSDAQLDCLLRANARADVQGCDNVE